MKTLFTITMLLVVAILSLKAQAPYTLSTSQMDYQKLTNSTSVNGSTVWSVQKFTIPLPFSVKIGNTTVNEVYTDGSVLYADTMGASVDIFQYLYAYTVDRGMGTATSKSPLRYEITGIAGSRIFKLESLSLGFYVENQAYGTMADSFNCQFWVYEGSNIVEIHFGDSKITHATDYFQAPAPSFCGYMNVNFNTGAGNSAYLASGNPLNAQPDSLTATHMPAPFTSFPASGTVYRFTPQTATANDDFIQTIPLQVYPTQTHDILNIDYTSVLKAHYQIYTLHGAQTYINGELQEGKNPINLSNLPTGIYLLEVTTSTTQITKRIIKF